MTKTDQNGTEHTYSYDVLGRQTADAITTLGSGVDGSVRRTETSYDSQGNGFRITNYDSASGGHIVSQIQREYNGFGQMTREYQSHDVINDDLVDVSKMFSYTGGIAFDSSNPTLFGGDGTRITRSVNTVQNVVYEADNMTSFSVNVYGFINDLPLIKFYVSSDNVTYTEVSVSRSTATATSGGWYYDVVTPDGDLPIANANYLKIEFQVSGIEWTPQITQQVLWIVRPDSWGRAQYRHDRRGHVR